MLAIERRNEILEKLQRDKRVVVGELSHHYEVSEETIRRDLEKLESEGYAIKSYGGAVLNENNNNIDLPFNIRKKKNIVGKQKIAELIKQMVHDQERIMLDASSTAVYIAKALKEKRELTLITNSIEIIIELFDQSDWHVLSTGGSAREGSFALVGPQTDKMLSSYHVDKAIISCKGLDLKAGITDSEELHARNKKTMLESAKEKILAMDSTKFDEIAFTQIGNLADLTTLVTDKKPEDSWLQALERMGIECIYPEP
ncbi:MAG TPA: DeoR/GlpR transcriptional regulator [Candidatus Merdenecus merdavium]|nr:DeoR/GlpR transcriptional regulator [Candidatus Merdenecus merdavium]